MVMKRRCQGDGDEAAWSVAEAGGCSYCRWAISGSGESASLTLERPLALHPRAAFSPTPYSGL